jgi:hypothetical protein
MGLGLFWLSGLGGLFALVASRRLLTFIAGLLGTLYPDAAIRVLAFIALLIVQVYLSVRLSRQEEGLSELAQAVALLEYELRGEARPVSGDPAADKDQVSAPRSKDITGPRT